MRAVVLGSMLLSAAEAKSEDERVEDFTLVWAAGIVLMAMGAIYTGQILHSASKFCLRRLRWWEDEEERRPRRRRRDDDSSDGDSIVVVSADESEAAGGRSLKKRSGRKGGTRSAITSSTSTPGQGPSTAASSTPVQGPSAAVPSTPVQGPFNVILTPGQGPSTSNPTSMSQTLRPRSGSEQRDSAADRAALAAADLVSSLAAVVSESSAAAEGASTGRKPDHEIKNPWNLFQRENQKRGWSPNTMARMYHRQKCEKP